MRALIVGNGRIDDCSILGDLTEEIDFILAADGGMNYLRKADLKPDLVIGDLDSISKENLDFIRKENIMTIKYPSEKDATDMELSIDYLIESGVKDISIVGFYGDRIDHSMANLFLLEYMNSKKILSRLVDGKNIVYLVDSSLRVKKLKKYVSIIPITDSIEVSLDGFKYPLDRKLIKRGSSLGVSNELLDSYGSVTVHTGKAFLILSDD